MKNDWENQEITNINRLESRAWLASYIDRDEALADCAAQSPFRMTLCTCLTNGSCGYFPVASAYEEGGYEARSSVFASTVAANIVAGHGALLRQI